MNQSLLRKHIKEYQKALESNPEKMSEEWQERKDTVRMYQSYTSEQILEMDEESFYEFITPLWAMLIWGNKRYIVDKLIADNGLDTLKKELVDLLWSDVPIEDRWDHFRTEIKGMGPAIISEILCKTHPDKYMIWNRRAQIGLNYLEVEGLPRYDYQLDGKKYVELCATEQEIAKELEKAGFDDTSLLMVDYFIWEELQVEENLSAISKSQPPKEEKLEEDERDFIHNDIRDKIRNIGQWLGFDAMIERKVSAGSQVDAVWESTIGNMGRVIYVFEVQTKGSIDSLIINLLNNPAVQGVVAVSDEKQITKIKKHVDGVSGLKDKLKYWDYRDVLEVHESLEFVNGNINKLGLVPEGF